MKITDVEVRIGVTVNLGNYESLRVDYSARGTIEPDETADQCIDKCRAYLKKKLTTDLEASNGGKAYLARE